MKLLSSARRVAIDGLALASGFVLAAAFSVGASAAPAKSSPRDAKADAVCHAGEASFFRDEALGVKVATKLQFTKALLREKIAVKVSGGVATLSGGVSTPEHIAQAVRVAREVEGVRCVNNFLKVGPPEVAPTGNPHNQ